jgi:hypothetical protein
MKWKAHTRTAEKVLSIFEALHFKKYEKELINGIIVPDNQDKETNHYTSREKTIINHLTIAREKRLQYDTRSSFFHLGVAFHYIQDAWTGIKPGQDDHAKYIELVNNCVILDHHLSLEKYYPVRRTRVLKQFRELEKRLSKPVETIDELHNLAVMRKPFESCAFLDMNLSFRVCHRLAEMVLKTMYNVELQEALERTQREYVDRIKEQEKREIQSLDTLEEQVGVLSLDKSTLGKTKHWKMNRRLIQSIKDYEARNHIKPIVSKFEARVKKLCEPHEKWYNIDKPSLDIDEIIKPDTERIRTASAPTNDTDREVDNTLVEKISGISVRFYKSMLGNLLTLS